MPAYDKLLVDELGNVWARPYSAFDLEPCWHVYRRATQGPEAFAKACLPERFTPLDIGASSILGVTRDENDVEFVVRHALISRLATLRFRCSTQETPGGCALAWIPGSVH